MPHPEWQRHYIKGNGAAFDLSSGISIGQKGMLVAAKTLALTALDLYKNPALIEKATAEWKQKRGGDFKYEALLGDRKPALDYRK